MMTCDHTKMLKDLLNTFSLATCEWSREFFYSETSRHTAHLPINFWCNNDGNSYIAPQEKYLSPLSPPIIIFSHKFLFHHFLYFLMYKKENGNDNHPFLMVLENVWWWFLEGGKYTANLFGEVTGRFRGYAGMGMKNHCLSPGEGNDINLFLPIPQNF